MFPEAGDSGTAENKQATLKSVESTSSLKPEPTIQPNSLRPNSERPPVCKKSQPFRDPTKGVIYILLVVFIGCITFAPNVALLRTQAIAAVSRTLVPNSASDISVQCDLGLAFANAGNPAQALAIYTSLESQLNALHIANDLRKPYVQLLMAHQYLKLNQPDKANLLWQIAVANIGNTAAINKTIFPTGITDVLLSLAREYDKSEDNDTNNKSNSAIALYEKLLALWSLSPPPDSKSNVECSLAALLEDKGEYQKALPLFISAYNTFKANGATQFNTHRLTHIGVNLAELGRNAEAQHILTKALEMATTVGWSDNKILCKYYLGRVSFELHDYRQSKTLLQQAMDMMSSSDNGQYWCWATYYLGRCSNALGDYNDARERFNKTLSLLDKYSGPPKKQVALDLANLPAK